ncbi:hypothetical protein L6V77_15515 [Myxococcota bacterium]|jgi:hypothetical protein|nr:hypothetical protein [Myxococcota bacterium]
MAFYCATCGKEIPNGKEIFARDDGRLERGGRPRHAACVPGGQPVSAAVDRATVARGTRVTCIDDRIVCRQLGADGEVETWLELPASLKQPLMAMVAEVVRGRDAVDYPVPGGDRLVVRREGSGGSLVSLHLVREPTGFPADGRRMTIPSADVDLFVAQCRGV